MVTLTKKMSARAERLWRRVMREGQPIDAVARECGIRPARLERLLIAIGKRRSVALRN